MIDKNNADHPARQKAIKILESIAKYMGNEAMFDCKSERLDVLRLNSDNTWYDLEDMVTNIILENDNWWCSCKKPKISVSEYGDQTGTYKVCDKCDKAIFETRIKE